MYRHRQSEIYKSFANKNYIFFRNLVRKLLKELFKNERSTLDKFVENMPNRDRAFFRVENYLNPFHPTKIVDKVKAASADNLIPMDKSRDMEKVQKAIKKVYFSFRYF